MNATTAPAQLESDSLTIPGTATDLIRLHRNYPARYPFLLESVAGNTATTARYSLLLAYPAEHLELRADGLFENDQLLEETDFLRVLNQHVRQLPPTGESPLPFNGGWFLYLGYELAGQVEPVLSLPASDSQLPVALAVRCQAAVILDHQTGHIQTCVEADHPDPRAMDSQLRADLAEAQRMATAGAQSLPKVMQCNEDPDEMFLNSVERIQEYIRAGDVFQVNLSRQWRIGYSAALSPADVYMALRKANPAPFAGMFQWQGSAVISSSPERLIEVQGRDLQTRPIAGTRPRLSSGDADAIERESLLLHPKERAEHIMLIDLERNDLGRVCEPGSVVVDELLGMETYAHVHHIVSNVRGKLRDECTPVDAIRAVFPGGTITGCPKVHCMEIIAELENTGRGPYTGAMGYLDRNGRLDLNILIRSLEIQGKQIRFRTGAGIVADSDARAELDETRAKARGLLKALGLAS